MDDLDDDIADLIGDPRPPAHSLAAQRGDVPARSLDSLVRQNRMDRGDDTSMLEADMHAGVTTGWLARVFGMDPSTVKKRLADCPPLQRRKAGYVYSLPQAAAYLVKPVFDVSEYLKTMRPSELPASLQKEYWDARLKRQRWEERAGELWRTDDVLDVLGEAFIAIKSSMQLWADNLERAVGLSDEQRRLLQGMVDGLQTELHAALVQMPKQRQTRSTASELDDGEESDG